MINENAEPLVQLRNGQVVDAYVYRMVLDLVESGHRITADASGGPVRVSPPIDPDAETFLDLRWHDTVAVVADLGIREAQN